MAITTTDLSRPGAAHVESYWAATAGEEVAGADPVRADIDTDVAIVGGGYTGLSAAYHLARDFGIKAHVLEANRIGWGCSGRNGGFASLGMGKHGYDGWAARWGEAEAHRIFEMSRQAIELVDDLLKREAIDADRTPSGGLELAHKPNRMAALEAGAKRMRQLFNMDVKLLDRDALRRDFLDSREAYGAALQPDGFAIHALRLARGIARAAQKQGAHLHGASPVTGWTRDGAKHLLRTPGGTVRAKRVLIAANGYAGDKLHPSIDGRTLPVLSNIIVTRPLTLAERQSVAWQTYLKIWDTRNLVFYYRLLPDNRILFGARGGVEGTESEHRYRRAWMERRLKEMFPPLAAVEVEYFWYGWVCATYDKNPHIGSAEDGTVLYALGYLGLGVALANYAGQLVARKLGGDDSVNYGALLGSPLPRFPFPPLRRVYQRIAYTGFGMKDEWL
jgi:glycine/D-amino acid oxidase-like deaminating enzyme